MILVQETYGEISSTNIYETVVSLFLILVSVSVFVGLPGAIALSDENRDESTFSVKYIML